MVERDRKNGLSDEAFSVGFFTGLPKADMPSTAENTSTSARRLAPRPDKGLPFNEALDQSMQDHHAVFAALAK